jgi:hypothetical protein
MREDSRRALGGRRSSGSLGSVTFYVEKIDAFALANANSKAGREKVASILRRYRDKKPPAGVPHEARHEANSEL